jgi:hypothetical protein
MTIFVFGNPDLPFDSLPLRLLPRLVKQFPDIAFEVKDPNEDWDVPEHLTVIDTAAGITDVTVFDDLNSFSPAPRVSLHDFDALANMRLLQKIGKIKTVKIIAVPMGMPEDEAFEKIVVKVRPSPQKAPPRAK